MRPTSQGRQSRRLVVPRGQTDKAGKAGTGRQSRHRAAEPPLSRQSRQRRQSRHKAGKARTGGKAAIFRALRVAVPTRPPLFFRRQCRLTAAKPPSSALCGGLRPSHPLFSRGDAAPKKPLSRLGGGGRRSSWFRGVSCGGRGRGLRPPH